MSGGIDWETLLRRAGATDVLQDTPLAQMGEILGFWCLQLTNVFPEPRALNEATGTLMECFNQHGRTLGKKAFSTKASGYAYQTISCAPHPCNCFDRYDGVQNSIHHTVHKWRPEAVAGEEVRHEPQNMQAVLTSTVRALFDRMQVPAASRPEAARLYLVGNRYHGTTAIGEHCDDSALYDATLHASSIATVSLCSPGVFVCKPSETADKHNGSKLKEYMYSYHSDVNWAQALKTATFVGKGMVVPIFVPENSVLVMGGTFQREMNHFTIAHHDLVNPNPRNSGVDDLPARLVWDAVTGQTPWPAIRHYRGLFLGEGRNPAPDRPAPASRTVPASISPGWCEPASLARRAARGGPAAMVQSRNSHERVRFAPRTDTAHCHSLRC